MPFLSTAVAIASIAAAGTGIGTSIANSGTASQGAQTNDQIASQELANKQQVFNQLFPFYSQYEKAGSPFLPNIQAASAGQNAQQFNNAAGNLRQTMQTSGLGYGPSGTTGAALGQMGTQAAQTSANSFLTNLLNNEQVKFQAAQGLQNTGNMMNNQNTVPQTPQPVNSQVGSSVNAFGQVLNGLPGNTSPTGGANVPGTPTTGPTPQQAGIPVDPAWYTGVQGTNI